MFRTNSPGSTGAGYYTNGNPATGVPATVVDAPWLNMVQDELENVLVAAGITPNEANSAQLLASIQAIVGLVPGNRNAFINSDFAIQQRNKTSTQGLGAGNNVNGAYQCDRWLQLHDAPAGTGQASTGRGTFALGQTAVPGEPRFFLHHQQTVGSNVSAPRFLQRIENVRAWAGKTATLQVWLKGLTSFSATARVTQNFGTGGAPSTAVVCGSAVFAVTSTWTLFTVTVTLPSIAGKTLGTAGNDHLLVEIELPAAATFTIDAARPQFEAGSLASAYESRTEAEELALCLRYYEKSYPLNVDPGTISAPGAARGFCYTSQATGAKCFSSLLTRFNVEKRATPAMTWYSPSSSTAGFVETIVPGTTSTVSSTSEISRTNTGFPITPNGNATNENFAAHWTADAEL